MKRTEHWSYQVMHKVFQIYNLKGYIEDSVRELREELHWVDSKGSSRYDSSGNVNYESIANDVATMLGGIEALGAGASRFAVGIEDYCLKHNLCKPRGRFDNKSEMSLYKYVGEHCPHLLSLLAPIIGGNEELLIAKRCEPVHSSELKASLFMRHCIVRAFKKEGINISDVKTNCKNVMFLNDNPVITDYAWWRLKLHEDIDKLVSKARRLEFERKYNKVRMKSEIKQGRKVKEVKHKLKDIEDIQAKLLSDQDTFTLQDKDRNVDLRLAKLVGLKELRKAVIYNDVATLEYEHGREIQVALNERTEKIFQEEERFTENIFRRDSKNFEKVFAFHYATHPLLTLGNIRLKIKCAAFRGEVNSTWRFGKRAIQAYGKLIDIRVPESIEFVLTNIPMPYSLKGFISDIDIQLTQQDAYNIKFKNRMNRFERLANNNQGVLEDAKLLARKAAQRLQEMGVIITTGRAV